MTKHNRLLAKLAGIIMGMPIIILVVYAWPFPHLRSIPLYGSELGVVASALLGFHFIRPSEGVVPAIVGALIIAVVVFLTSWFLIANIIGE
jgi:hypothetical protein